jgi:hypothetical protein
MSAYKYLGVLTRQFRDRPKDFLVLVAMRHDPKSVKERWYQPHDELKPLLEWSNSWNSKGYNIYACWASFTERTRSLRTMSASSAFVADFDGEDPTFLDTTPTICVETSPGRWQHVYTHELASGSSVGRTYKNLARRLTGIDTGPSGDPVHLWRVPGYQNLPKAEKRRAPSVAKWDGQVNGRSSFTFEDAVVGKSLIPRWLQHHINVAPPVGSRSEAFHKLVGDLAKLGWDADRITAKLTGTWAEEKFEGRLSEEVERSFEKVEKPEPKDYRLVFYNPEDQEEVIRWLWFPYLPLNEVTLVDGDGGVGKTAMMLRIAKELIEGGAAPNGQKLAGGRKVLFISTESNYKRVTLPLLKRMGAKRYGHFIHLEDPGFTLDEQGIQYLREVIRDNGLHMIVIDPLAQFLPLDVEMNSYQHAIYLMSRLQAITEELQCAIVLIRHNGKGSKEQLSYRGVGSIGWQSSCRSQLVVRKDPQDEDQFIVAPTKHQHASARDARPFIYEWKSVDNRGIIEWVGMSDITNEELNEAKPDKEQRAKKKECSDWLKDFLRERRSSTDVHTQGEARGFNRKMLERTSHDLGVMKSALQRRPDGTRGTISYWELAP